MEYRDKTAGSQGNGRSYEAERLLVITRGGGGGGGGAPDGASCIACRSADQDRGQVRTWIFVIKIS